MLLEALLPNILLEVLLNLIPKKTSTIRRIRETKLILKTTYDLIAQLPTKAHSTSKRPSKRCVIPHSSVLTLSNLKKRQQTSSYLALDTKVDNHNEYVVTPKQVQKTIAQAKNCKQAPTMIKSYKDARSDPTKWKAWKPVCISQNPRGCRKKYREKIVTAYGAELRRFALVHNMRLHRGS